MDKSTSEKLEAVNQICEMIDDIYYRYAVSFGVTDTELSILYALTDHDGEYMQSDICREWSCSLQTIHTTVKNMERKGLIELRRKDGNKKNKYIYLTDAGRRFSDGIMKPLTKAEGEALESLTEEEQDMFLPLFRKYADALSISIGNITKRR